MKSVFIGLRAGFARLAARHILAASAACPDTELA
jgi:hypothetical protein